MAGRRELTFASLDEVTPDVERLLAGHVTLGNWSLGQICHHLAMALRMSMDGVPVKASWLVRRTFGAVARRLLLRGGRMPKGIRVPEVYLPKPGLDAACEGEALQAALERFRSHAGPLHEHPLLGPLSRDQWERFHCIHCAHHLNFALPAAPV